jgi:poly-gamma-glutamate synthesis protein (capsule biosynthesis protein)
MMLLCACAEAARSDEPLPALDESAREAPSAEAAAVAPAAADPEPAAPADERAERVVLIAGGDVNLGRDAGQLILRDPAYAPFAGLRPLLESGDVRFVNLESVLSDQRGETQSPHHRLVFTGPPGGADVLRAAGIDIVSFANNHVWDYHARGFEETLANLERVGIAYAGAHREPDDLYQPTVVRVKGWSLAFFAVTHIWNYGAYRGHPGSRHVGWADPDKLREPVARALREHDLVLISYHGARPHPRLPSPM